MGNKYVSVHIVRNAGDDKTKEVFKIVVLDIGVQFPVFALNVEVNYMGFIPTNVVCIKCKERRDKEKKPVQKYPTYNQYVHKVGDMKKKQFFYECPICGFKP